MPLYPEWLYILWNQSRLELSDGRWNIYSRLWFHGKLIEASTGRFPEFFGKPSKHTLDYIIQQTGYEPDEIAIVGDRLYTDIAVADQSDVMSILVLSGESTREDVKTSDVKPNVILEDLSEITKML